MRLFVDGEMVAAEASGPPIASDGSLRIGCGVDNGYADYFDGRLDAVRVYDRAVTPAEATDIVPPRFPAGQKVMVLNLPEEPLALIPPAVDTSPTGASSGLEGYMYRFTGSGTIPISEWALTEDPYIDLPEVLEGETVGLESMPSTTRATRAGGSSKPSKSRRRSRTAQEGRDRAT